MTDVNTVTADQLDETGRVRRKYELPEEQESKQSRLIAIGLIISTAFFVVKKTLFGFAKEVEEPSAGNKFENEISEDEENSELPQLEIVEDSGSELEVIHGAQEYFYATDDGSRVSRFSLGLDFDVDVNSSFNYEGNGAFVNFPPPFSGVFDLSNVIVFPTRPTRPDSGDPGGGTGNPPPGGGGNPTPPDPGGDGDPTGGGGDPTPGDDDPDDGEPDRVNNAPYVQGPLALRNIYVNQSILISIAALMEGAHDPDGDPLIIENLTVSSGEVTYQQDGWVYTPGNGYKGSVTVNYNVSDLDLHVTQTASFEVLEVPGTEIWGTDGDDRLVGTPGDDRIDAKAGDDTVIGREGNDFIHGREGDDRIVGNEGDDVIYAGAGDDVVFGGAGDDFIFGEQGDDFLSGDEGNDTISGGEGDDTALGGHGDDHVLGEEGDDTLSGGMGDDFVDGGVGNDDISGGMDNDVLVGGTGTDTAHGDDGDDVFIAEVSDDDDHYDGGEGSDTYILSATTAPATVNLETEEATSSETGTDELKDIENVVGSLGDDEITGNAEVNDLQGSLGDDHIKGGDGGDILQGDEGNDELEGEAGDDLFVATVGDGNDTYDGGDGEDTFDASALTERVEIDLEAGTITSTQSGVDTVHDIENVIGGKGDDVITADESANKLFGGHGNDKFVFKGKNGKYDGIRDIVQDFEIGDKIDFTEFDGNEDDSGFQKITFQFGKAEFDGIGQAVFVFENKEEKASTLIRFNLSRNENDDDNDKAEYEIEVLGMEYLTFDSLIT